MAYYLTDPYYHTPKCYPFLNNDWTYAERLHSERLTQLGRNIQTKTATSMLQTACDRFQDTLKCEQNLLRCKYMMAGRDNGQQLAEIQSNRKVKEQCLRKQTHKFPKFLQHQNIINEYKRDSQRMNPEEYDD